MKMYYRKYSMGLTLVELLVAMATSLLLMAGVIAFYVDTLESNGLSLNGSRLNQESSAALSVMVNEIRRAGFDGAFANNDPLNNNFNAPDTELTVLTSATSNTVIGPTDVAGGQCIIFAYDLDQDGAVDPADGTVDPNEWKGFRLNDGAIQARTCTAASPCTTYFDCTTDSEWTDITDNTFLTVTDLNFRLHQSTCLNLSVDADTYGTEAAYLADATGDNCFDTATSNPAGLAAGNYNIMRKRKVIISLATQLNADALVTRSWLYDDSGTASEADDDDSQAVHVTVRNHIVDEVTI